MPEVRLPPCDEKLSHLAKEEIENLISRYYSGETISALLKEYDIAVAPRSLPKILPPEVCEEVCAYCDVHLLQARGGRSTDAYSRPRPRCPVCQHTPTAVPPFGCDCAGCRQRAAEIHREADERRRQETERLRERTLAALNKARPPPVALSSLSLRQRVLLSALMRSGMRDDGAVGPRDVHVSQLGAHERHDIDILRDLVRADLVWPSAHTRWETISVDEDGSVRFDLFQSAWDLNVRHSELSPSEVAKGLFVHPFFDGPVKETMENLEGVVQLWNEIAREECVRYVESRCTTVDLNFRAPQKLRTVLDDLLTRHPPSVVYSVIYSAVKNAVHFQASNRANSAHAANTIPGTMIRYAENIESGRFQAFPFRPLPETSSLVSVFFFTFLKIDDWFNERPIQATEVTPRQGPQLAAAAASDEPSPD